MAKHFSGEYKKSIVHLYINGKTAEEIVNEYGIPRATFFGWLKKYRSIKLSEDEIMTA